MKTNLGSGLLLLSLLAGAQLPSAERAESIPRITIRLTNLANASNTSMAKGRKLAAYILRKAGVAVIWLDCSAGSVDRQSGRCSFRPGGTEFQLYIDNERAATSTEAMLGFTAVNRDPESDLRVAADYYPRVQSMAERLRADRSHVLGAVMAHEIGHLLGADHAPDGVMCPGLNQRHIEQAGMGRLLFSEPQAKPIRTAAALRNAAWMAR